MGIQLLSAVVGQTGAEPDPELVTPGALGLALVLMLGLAIVLLYKSMNRHLGRISAPPADPRAMRPTKTDDPGSDESDHTA